jgi:hypothetical protein
MDERIISNRFHEALDAEPRAGAYDRMRFALTSSPILLRQPSGFRKGFNRMGFRIVAAVVAAVIVVVAVVAYVSLRHPSVGMVPATQGPDIRPYQALIARDYAKTLASESGNCLTITDSACATAVNRITPNLESWLQDLNSISSPPRFTRIDAMLRSHLTEAVAAGNAAIAAQKAGNAALFDAAITVNLDERPFIVAIAAAIADTKAVPAASYSSDVQDQMDLFNSCTPCAPYAATAPVLCTKTPLPSCVNDVVAVDAQIYDFESAVVQQAAPASLAAKDAKLQADLVAADAALLAMERASLGGDPAGFASASSSAQASVSAVAADVAAIRNG